VIGCGAGFPGLRQQPRFYPDYIAFAGTYDFNMNELISLNKQLDPTPVPHALILFNGKHAWPPADILENAFFWTEFCSMRKGLIAKNDTMIRDYLEKQNKSIEEDAKRSDYLAEYDHLDCLIRFMNGIMPTDKYLSRMKEIGSSVTYQLQLKKQQKELETEMRDQQSLNDDFYVKDLDWWKSRLASYDRRISKGKDSADVRMCKRLKSYLSLISYMNYSQSLSSGDSASAKHAMAIYEQVDPENAALTKAGKAK